MKILTKTDFRTLYRIMVVLLKKNGYARDAKSVRAQYWILASNDSAGKKEKALDVLSDIFHPKNLRDDSFQDRKGRAFTYQQWNRIVDAFMAKAKAQLTVSGNG
jgi:hypothetical protein